MKRLIPHILLLFLLAFGLSHAIATERERITPENIDRLTEIASIGRGTVEQLILTPDSKQVIASTAEGAYIYNSDDLSANPYFIETNRLLEYKVTSDGQYLVGWQPVYYFNPKNHQNPFWVWDLASYSLLYSTEAVFSDNNSWPGDITAILPFPNSSRLLLFNARGKVYEWDVSAPEIVNVIPVDWDGPFAPDNARVFSTDGRFFAQCFNGGIVQVVNTATWETVSRFRVIDTRSVPWSTPCLSFSDDGTALMAQFEYDALGGNIGDFNVAVGWSLVDNTLLYKRRLPSDSVVTFDADGTPTAMISERISPDQWGYYVRLMELDTGKIRWITTSHYNFHDGIFGNQHNLFLAIAYGGDARYLTMWDLNTAQILWSHTLPFRAFHDISFVKGRLLIGGASSGDIQGWRQEDTVIEMLDIASGQILSATTDHIHHFYDPTFDPSSRYIASGDKNGIRIFDTATWETSQAEIPVESHFLWNPRLHFVDLAFGTDGSELFATVSSSNGTTFDAGWSITDWTIADVPPSDSFFIIHHLSPSRNLMGTIEITSYDDPMTYRITVVDRRRGDTLFSQDSTARINVIGFSTDDKMIAIPNSNGEIVIWDIATNEIAYQFESQIELENSSSYYFYRVTFSPDNRWLIVSRGRTSHEIWNLETQEYWGNVYQIEFSPTHQYFVAIDPDTFTLQFFDINTGQQLDQMGEIENVIDPSFSPDGLLLAVVSVGGGDYFDDPLTENITIYRTSTTQILAIIDNPTPPLNPFFSPDGTLLAVQAADRRLIVYGIE